MHSLEAHFPYVQLSDRVPKQSRSPARWGENSHLLGDKREQESSYSLAPVMSPSLKNDSSHSTPEASIISAELMEQMLRTVEARTA